MFRKKEGKKKERQRKGKDKERIREKIKNKQIIIK